MAKSQTNQSTSDANAIFNQASSVMNPVIQGLQGQSSQAQANQAALLGQADTGFLQQQSTGGYDPTMLSYLRGSLQQMQPTGGYDPAQLTNLRGEYSSLLPTGGYDPTQLANIRGNLANTTAGYQNFANTGGYTPAMQQQTLQAGTASNRNLTSALAAAAQRGAAASGGNAQAAISDIARTGGQTEAATTGQANLALNQAINQGKLAGLGGLGTTAGQQAQLESGVASGVGNILGQQGTTEGNVATGARQVAGLQTGLEGGVASGVQGANQGLAGLFNTQTGQVTALGQQILQGLGLQFGSEEQAASILQALSKNPGAFQTIFGDITGLISAAGGGTGLKALGVP